MNTRGDHQVDTGGRRCRSPTSADTDDPFLSPRAMLGKPVTLAQNTGDKDLTGQDRGRAFVRGTDRITADCPWIPQIPLVAEH